MAYIAYWQAGVRWQSGLYDLCIKSMRCRRYLKHGNSPFPAMFSLSDVTDNGDNQWSSFRSALPILTLFAASSLVVFRAVLHLFRGYKAVTKSRVNLALGLGFLFYVHGLGSVFPLFFAFLFHSCSMALR